jgi:uncharacterized protein YcgI (DUF1989 family)
MTAAADSENPAWQDLWRNTAAYQVDAEFYGQALAASEDARNLVSRIDLPPLTADAFVVEPGQTFRIIEQEGPQIVSVSVWNADNPREGFIGGRTMSIDGCFVLPFSRLWSDLPWLRPLATCIADTTARTRTEAVQHHLIGTPCSSESRVLFGQSTEGSCRTAILTALQRVGVGQFDPRDSVNLHQRLLLEPHSGRVRLGLGEATPGDYIEFFAELKLLVGTAVCPQGDGGSATKPTVRPIRVEVYDTGIEPLGFPAWTDWRSAWSGRWQRPG